MYDDAIPEKMTLYQARRRKIFDDDPEKNQREFEKKRRGYEGKEHTVLLTL
ncbi:MAG TPA: hypothetical protein PK659_07430 [Methanothrix sp.]|nr:hypothetical protein [Methanothrix sp.]HOL44063.1 hypothetical protein [Methanothrix sp.]